MTAGRLLVMRRYLLIYAFCLTALLTVVLSERAMADVGDSDRLSLRPGHPAWITRNLVDGRPIPTCSDAFPNATRAAVERWNTALGLTAFVMSTQCDVENRSDWNPADGAVSITVTLGVAEPGWVRGKYLQPGCRRPSRACAGFDRWNNRHVTPDNDLWRSFHGRAEIIINPGVWCRDLGSAPSICPIDPDGPSPQPDTNSTRSLVDDITHELGHILGLRDYHCSAANMPGEANYLTSATPSTLNTDAEVPHCDPKPFNPTRLDKDDYRTVYRPAVVTNLKGEADRQTVTLTWNQDKVFVESHFEIQRWSGTRWVVAATAPANSVSAKLTAQRPGDQRYRIVSRTRALPNVYKGPPPAPGPTSEEAVVTVYPLVPPTNVRLSVSGGELVGRFLWLGTAPRAIKWELRRSATEDGDYNHVAATKEDSTSPVEFDNQTVGYWYRLHGRACETRTDPGAQQSGVRGQQAQPFEVCGTWSGFSKPVKFRRATVAPPPPPKPADTFADREVVRSSWTAWELEGDGTVICYFQQYRYTRFVIQSWITTHSWNGARWVPSSSLFLTSSVMTRKTALPGTRPVSCFLSRESDGVSSASATAQQFLLEGDYVFRWGDKHVSFSVPKNAQINLNWRVLASGVRAAVLTDEGTGEVLVHPGAVAAATDEVDQRSAALQSIERSLRQTSAVSGQGAGAPGVACAVVSSDASEPQVDLDANRCATAASGGRLRITADASDLTLTLTADRHWIIARVRTAAGEYGPIALFDVSTTSSLLLDPVTGSEVGRTISEGADSTLVGLFDAIVASVKRIESATDSP